jgi:hypothetical protein
MTHFHARSKHKKPGEQENKARKQRKRKEKTKQKQNKNKEKTQKKQRKNKKGEKKGKKKQKPSKKNQSKVHTSSLWLSKCLAISLRPCLHATCNGVCPSRSLASLSAPADSR